MGFVFERLFNDDDDELKTGMCRRVDQRELVGQRPRVEVADGAVAAVAAMAMAVAAVAAFAPASGA